MGSYLSSPAQGDSNLRTQEDYIRAIAHLEQVEYVHSGRYGHDRRRLQGKECGECRYRPTDATKVGQAQSQMLALKRDLLWLHGVKYERWMGAQERDRQREQHQAQVMANVASPTSSVDVASHKVDQCQVPLKSALKQSSPPPSQGLATGSVKKAIRFDPIIDVLVDLEPGRDDARAGIISREEWVQNFRERHKAEGLHSQGIFNDAAIRAALKKKTYTVVSKETGIKTEIERLVGRPCPSLPTLKDLGLYDEEMADHWRQHVRPYHVTAAMPPAAMADLRGEEEDDGRDSIVGLQYPDGSDVENGSSHSSNDGSTITAIINNNHSSCSNIDGSTSSTSSDGHHADDDNHHRDHGGDKNAILAAIRVNNNDGANNNNCEDVVLDCATKTPDVNNFTQGPDNGCILDAHSQTRSSLSRRKSTSQEEAQHIPGAVPFNAASGTFSTPSATSLLAYVSTPREGNAPISPSVPDAALMSPPVPSAASTTGSAESYVRAAPVAASHSTRHIHNNCLWSLKVSLESNEVSKTSKLSDGSIIRTQVAEAVERHRRHPARVARPLAPSAQPGHQGITKRQGCRCLTEVLVFRPLDDEEDVWRRDFDGDAERDYWALQVSGDGDSDESEGGDCMAILHEMTRTVLGCLGRHLVKTLGFVWNTILCDREYNSRRRTRQRQQWWP